ncbi:MAG: hypothetical protein FIB01_07910 [Gemmatimonadetes bacterium]|nr:hypothetical protein [Gemmatimonadota bacterium]
MNWRSKARLGTMLAVAATLSPLSACSDPYGPLDWDATPDTATIWSGSRVELVGRPAGFDFALNLAPVFIESVSATNAWDVVLIDVGGRLALAPASYFEGQGARSAIAVRPNATLADIRRAPSDTTEYVRQPVSVEAGTVYVVRTRTDVCEGGYTTGTRYAKLRAVSIEQQAGSFTFELVRNPYCSNRNFIPPGSGD